MSLRDHLDAESLLSVAEGRPLPRERQARAHHSGCERCAAELRCWERIAAALADDLAAPPEEIIRRALALFVSRQASTPKEQRPAVLIWDSRAQPRSVAARDTPGGGFKLLFQAGETHIDLLCDPGSAGWEIAGQVHAPEAPVLGWHISAVGKEGESRRRTDHHGEFLFGSLPPGTYALTVQDLTYEIVLPGVHLPAL